MEKEEPRFEITEKLADMMISSDVEMRNLAEETIKPYIQFRYETYYKIHDIGFNQRFTSEIKFHFLRSNIMIWRDLPEYKRK